MVSIIIVNYNTPSLVHDCLASIDKMVTIDHEVILVESGTEHPADPIDLDRFGCIHIPTDKRRGFGEANNLGAEKASGKYLWLLNSDTVIPTQRINEAFSLFEDHPKVGIISPALYNDHALQIIQPDFYASFQNLFNLITRNARPYIDWSLGDKLPELVMTDLVVGASLIIRADLFRSIGGFDEKIFMYMEDDDICYRAKKAGYDTAIATQMAVVHLQGQSISKNRVRKGLYYQSQNYFWQKHYGLWPALIMRAIRLPFRIFKG